MKCSNQKESVIAPAAGNSSLSRKGGMSEFQENALTDGGTQGGMDRTYFIGPFRLSPGVQLICSVSSACCLLKSITITLY